MAQWLFSRDNRATEPCQFNEYIPRKLALYSVVKPVNLSYNINISDLWLLLEINALEGLKMLYLRPYISKSSGGACPRTALAAHAFCARDCPPNLTESVGRLFCISSPLTLQNNAYPRWSNNWTMSLYAQKAAIHKGLKPSGEYEFTSTPLSIMVFTAWKKKTDRLSLIAFTILI